MLAGERELYERFVDYKDEVLLRILTVERAQYRREALAAAELVLAHRGAAAPGLFTAPEPPAPYVKRRARPKSPYQFVDLCVDVVLFGSLYWVTWKLDIGTVMPESWVADAAVRLMIVGLLTVGVMYLRHGWRTKEW